MNRSSFILGIALLVVAVTLAVTITVRNAPRDGGTVDEGGLAVRGRIRDCGHSAINSAHSGETPRVPVAARRHPGSRAIYQVTVPDGQMALLPADQRDEWVERAAEVEREAQARLERMTEEFDLSGEQRRKMFPMLARSTAGFDPRMQVGGVYLDSDPGVLPDEEVHDVLDPDQQEQLVDDEIDRQLWWQDIFSRLEKELIDSTGGAQTEPAVGGEVAPPPVDEERSDPAPRTGGSLGGLLGQ